MGFNLEQKVPVTNLCNWDLFFRRSDNLIDIRVPANAKNYGILTYNEIQMQIQLNNIMFVGDGLGNHARIKVEDDEIRKSLFGITEGKKQVLLTLDVVKELLTETNKTSFTKKLKQLVNTEAEKKMIVEYAKQAKIDNVEKWKSEKIEEISGYKFE